MSRKDTEKCPDNGMKPPSHAEASDALSTFSTANHHICDGLPRAVTAFRLRLSTITDMMSLMSWQFGVDIDFKTSIDPRDVPEGLCDMQLHRHRG